MPYRSDFFTAKQTSPGVYDRVYTSDRFASRFSQLFTNGIVIPGGSILGTQLQVSKVNNTMDTSVNLGLALINGYCIEVFDTAFTLTHVGADPVNPRIDRIILELNLTDAVRSIDVKILSGVAAGSPSPQALTRTSSIYQLCLADILIPANVTNLNTATLTDRRSDATLCGIANVAIGVKPDNYLLIPTYNAHVAENVLMSDTIRGAIVSPTYTNNKITQLLHSIAGVVARTDVFSYPILSNLISNGSFETGTLSSWTLRGGGIAANNVGWWVAKSTSESGDLCQDIVASDGHKIYCLGSMDFVVSPSGGYIQACDYGAYTNPVNANFDKTILNTWQYKSVLKTASGGGVRVVIGNYSAGAACTVYFDNIICLDLTAIFGAGKEPSQSEMDAIMSLLGYYFTSANLIEEIRTLNTGEKLTSRYCFDSNNTYKGEVIV